MRKKDSRGIGITDSDMDAIVNATNDRLWTGCSVFGAIFKMVSQEQF